MERYPGFRNRKSDEKLRGRNRANDSGLPDMRISGQGTGGSVHTPVLLLSEIGAHDPRIRVDPDAVPVARGTAGSVANLRELCTATLVGPSTVMTAARCTLNHRALRYFPPKSLHFLIGYDGNRYAGYAMRICPGLGDGVVGLRRSV